jgi:hypothetical protein
MKRFISLGSLLAGLVAVVPSTPNAAEFTLVPDQSVIQLAGTAISFPLQQQGAGSLSTKYRGSIQADVAGGTIKFTGGSIIAADNNGSWQPLADGVSGSAPACYGGKADGGFLGQALAAARNVKMDVASGDIPISGTSFDSRSLLWNFRPDAMGVLDFVVTGFAAQKGSVVLAGYATNKVTATASLVTSGSVQTLTIPVEADFYFKLMTDNDTKLTVRGTLVATRNPNATTGNTFTDWTKTAFPGQSDPGVVGPDADPDRDGIANFVEFALGMDPKAPDAKKPFTSAINPQNPQEMVITFTRPTQLAAKTVNYGFKSGNQLGQWAPLALSEEVLDLGNGKERVTLKQTVAPDTARSFFLMLTASPR